MAKGFATAFSHNLDRKAAIKIRRIFFPVLEFGFITFDQGIDEGVIFGLIHRAVDVILAVALVIARLEPCLVEINAFLIDNRRNRIKEGEAFFAGFGPNGFGEWARGQRAGSNDGMFPFHGG